MWIIECKEEMKTETKESRNKDEKGTDGGALIIMADRRKHENFFLIN